MSWHTEQAVSALDVMPERILISRILSSRSSQPLARVRETKLLPYSFQRYCDPMSQFSSIFLLQKYNNNFITFNLH